MVVEYAKEEKIVRERDPKSGGMMVSKEACEYVGDNCRYYEPVRTRKGKVMKMTQWLNFVTKKVPKLQKLLVSHGSPLRKNLLDTLEVAQLPDWDIIECRDQGVISFRNGYVDLTRRDDRGRPAWRFVPNDGAEDHRIAPVHFDLEFPDQDEYYGLTHEQLRAKCPAFDQVLQCQSDLETCKAPLTFNDPTRAASSKELTGMEIYLFALMRAAMPYNDRLKFMPWVVGASGAGKTEIFQWILQQLLGRSYIQVLQDGAHGDKFTINEHLLDMSLIVFSDTRGTPLTAEQMCKLANHEAMATRGMRETASDADATANAIAFTNVQPQWRDEGGALVGRLMVLMLESVESPDTTLPDRLPREMPWILLTLLDAHRRVACHVLPSPYKQWQHPVFTLSRQVQESEHVLADLLLNYVGVDLSCADGSYLTVTLEPAPVGKAPLAKVQAAVTALCERTSLVPVPRVDRRRDESDVRGILARCSALLDLSSADTLILVLRQDVWKCKECGAVTFVKDTTASEDWGCEHCSAGDKGTGTRKTTHKIDQPYIRGMRVRETSTQDGFFGSAALPNAGRGAGDDEAPIVQEWAIKKDMDKFVPRPTAAALASPDGHDPSAYTSRERAGTTTFTGHPTEQFFNPKRTYFPTAQAKREWASLFGGDCLENAEDKDAWVAETVSGRFDSVWVSTLPAHSSDAGSMCPVEHGGSHVDGQLPNGGRGSGRGGGRDPVQAVLNDPYLMHKILLCNVHEELLVEITFRAMKDHRRMSTRRYDRQL